MGAACPADCSGNGKCNDGVCACKKGFEGAACLDASCPENCNGQGVCDPVQGMCICSKGFVGLSCSTPYAAAAVTLKAKEVSVTFTPITVPAAIKPAPIVDDEPETIASPVTCPNDCSGNGKCNEGGRCTCKSGFKGDDCSTNVEEQHKKCEAQCTAEMATATGAAAAGAYTACVTKCEAI